MRNRNGILAAAVLAALLLTLVAPAPAWAGGADDPVFSSATWGGWLRGLLTDLWPAPDALLRLIGREGPGMDPNGTPSPEAGTVRPEGDPGLSNLIGRAGPGMDPNGTPSEESTGETTVPLSGTSATAPPPGS